MIIKCKRLLNDYDFQIIIIFKYKWFLFNNYFQMQTIIICKWLLNDYDYYLLIIIKCKWFANANYY